MNESNGTVLDILIYVFDHYMLTEAVNVPERDELTLDLERAGFALEQVEQALDWLAGLTRRMPFWTGLVFIVLGLWSMWFGAYVSVL